MPIVPLVNGASMQGVDISSMHADLQALINNIPQSSLGRFTFNHQQLEHMSAGGDLEASSGSVDVVKSVNTTDLTAGLLVAASMTKILEEAPGTIDGPAHVLIWAYWEVTGWPANTNDQYQRHSAVLGLGIEVDGGAIAFPDGRGAQGLIRSRPYTGYATEAAGPNSGWRTEDYTSGSIFAYYDGTAKVGAWDIDAITLWAAACKCGSTQVLATGAGGEYYKVARANISWLAIRSA